MTAKAVSGSSCPARTPGRSTSPSSRARIPSSNPSPAITWTCLVCPLDRRVSSASLRHGRGVGLPVRERTDGSTRGGHRRPLGSVAAQLIPLYALAAVVVCAAGGWYLLKELAPLLRPLILAVFLAYTILPVHRRLSQWVPSRLAGPLLALLAAVAVLGVAVLVYGNLVALRGELPRLIDRARGLVEGVRAGVATTCPPGSSSWPRIRAGPRRTPRRGSRPLPPAWSTPRRASWPRPWSSGST